MLHNFLKTALRGFWRHKFFTLVNVLGLTIGTSSALVIYLIVSYDLSFNRFEPDSKRVYRIVTNSTFMGEAGYNGGVCGPLAAAVQIGIPGLERVAPFFTIGEMNVIINHNKNSSTLFRKNDGIILADNRYFALFKYKWVAGSTQTALNTPNQIVLTTIQAKKYFPGLSYMEMLNRPVVYDSIRTIVKGIVEPLKGNNDFTFSDFISYSTYTNNKALKDQLELTDWGLSSGNSQLYVKLRKDAQFKLIEKQLVQLFEKNHPRKQDDKGNSTAFYLQPFNELHFDGRYGAYNLPTGNRTTLYGLSAIAAFILLLACINFINLTTAQSSQRAKEIGIRKTMGSSRFEIITQILSETILITSFAVFVGLLVCPVILWMFKDFLVSGINANYFAHQDIALFILILIATVSLIAGYYPALILSSLRPAQVIRNQVGKTSGRTAGVFFRKTLTVTQFFIAQFFIMAALLVSKQIYYALHKDLGFKKDAIVMINIPWKNATVEKNKVFLAKLKQILGISKISEGNDPPATGGMSAGEAIYHKGKHEIKTELQVKNGDLNYINVYQIKLLAGRNFRTGDSGRAALINMNYARKIEAENAQDAVGKFFDFNGKHIEIIGVIADFYQTSFRHPIRPIAIFTGQTGVFHIALQPHDADGKNWNTAIAAMQSAWQSIYPDDDFQVDFFDQNIANLYTNERQAATLLTWATGISILISCLGLLGLTIYTSNQRTKEIGVRKVLGASVAQIVRLLSSELVLLVILSFALVTPVSWWAMHKWMESFAEKTAISWWIFALSGGLMLLATLLTMSLQTIKTATANPVESLRNE